VKASFHQGRGEEPERTPSHLRSGPTANYRATTNRDETTGTRDKGLLISGRPKPGEVVNESPLGMIKLSLPVNVSALSRGDHSVELLFA